jgi:tRNA threonylcarbamoyladenosine biosynthesis protein TsaB
VKVLAIDTSSRRGSLALLDADEIVGELRLLAAETHSARLLPGVEFLLSGAGWRLGDLDLVAAGVGPGSFTGIRIGVSTALGLAQTLGRPLAPVSGLDALADALRHSHRALTRPPLEAAVGIAMDASRGQVYYSEYRASSGDLRRTVVPVLVSPAELGRILGRRKLWLAGEGARQHARELGLSSSGGRRRLVDLDLFLAVPVGRLAQRRRRSWRRGEFLAADPLYIRPPDAVAKRRAGEKA